MTQPRPALTGESRAFVVRASRPQEALDRGDTSANLEPAAYPDPTTKEVN